MAHPSTSQIGMQSQLQNHSGARARSATCIASWHVRHRTTFMAELEHSNEWRGSLGRGACQPETGCGNAVRVTATPAPLTFAVLGDSIAYGQGAARPADTPAARLTAVLQAAGVSVDARIFAVPGSRSAGLAAQVDRALRENPDLVLIIVGANDLTHFVPPAQAAAELAAAVIRLVAAGAEVVVAPAPDLSVVPWLPPAARPFVQATSQALHRAQAAAARDAGAHVVDLTDIAAPFRSDVSMFSADRFHPSSAGYALIARGLADPVVAAARTALARLDRSA